MSAVIVRSSWKGGDRDEEGYRSYVLCSRIRTSSYDDGPAVVMQCPGLPQPGAVWSFGNDFDSWAWCRPTMKVTPKTPLEPCKEWEVEQTFSSKPLPPNQQRCNNTPIEDPLLEPQKISGSFTKYTEETSIDRFGNPIVNSAWEPITGPQAEFDANRTSIVIEQNVLDLQLPLIDAMKNTVNDDFMWGVPRRCIKLSEVTFDRKFYGQCFPYYTRKFTFDINIKKDPVTGTLSSGFDHDVSDKGTKMLYGHWDAKSGDYIVDKLGGVITPDPKNPQHFIAAKTRDGATTNIPLNGFGLPAGVNVRSGCSLYMCNSNGPPDYSLGDEDWWTKLMTDPTAKPIWAAGCYSIGALVNYNTGGAVFVAFLQTGKGTDNLGKHPKVPTTRDEPSKATLNPLQGNPWVQCNNVTPRLINNDPNIPSYDPLATYNVGDYVAVQADIGPYFMSLVSVANHKRGDLIPLLSGGKMNVIKVGDSFTDPWIKLPTSPNVSPAWKIGEQYEAGVLIYYRGDVTTFGLNLGFGDTTAGLYVQTNPSGVKMQQPPDPNGSYPGREGNTDWLPFSAINYCGNYNPDTTYNFGDYVSPGATYQGKVHVEKYDESNMFLLGIPITLV